MSFARRSLAPPPTPVDDPADATSDALTTPDAGIPPHVWALLQEAGEEAAQRLTELLQPHAFNKLAGSVQRALLDLALTRAYGLPVRRSVAVSLSSSDSDAVAASLLELRNSLPERSERPPTPRDVTPRPETPDDTQQPLNDAPSASDD